MKRIEFAAIILCLACGGAFAATVGVWNGPIGSWMDGSLWSTSPDIPPAGAGTGDELKITPNGSVCTVDTTVPAYVCRLSVASGPDGATLEILPGGNLAMGETRFGAAGATSAGSLGIGVQSGGTLTVKDLLLGRWASGKETGRGFYTISGGTVTFKSGETGRLYIGAGNSGGYTEGTLTIVGSHADVLFRSMYMGNLNYGGKATLALECDPNGISPVTLTDYLYLDAAPENSVVELVITASETLPARDLVLIDVTSSNAISGAFDTINGEPAIEGAEVIVGDNIYALTYKYAVSGGIANDIALIYLANINDLAHSPTPVNGASVETTLASLFWTLPEPNVPGTDITCDVYLGTEPNRPQMDIITLGANVSTVEINKTNFKTFGALTNKTTYYWVVDCHDPSTGPDPIEGLMWSFYTDNNEPPTVGAGDDQVVWLGKSGTPGEETVTLSGAASDDGLPGPLSVQWTQVLNDAPTVTITDADKVAATVTITEAGTYEFMLTADDGDKQTSDTVQVIVGTTACDASHISTGDLYNTADVNQDCLVDLADFVTLIADNWLTCTDTLTLCGM